MRGTRKGMAAAVFAALAAVGIGGCDEEPQEGPEPPEGAISAVENQPRSLGDGMEVIASDIGEDGAYLALFAEDGEELSGWTDVGDSMLLAGHEITLVSTWVDPDQGGAPGSVGSTAYLMVVSDLGGTETAEPGSEEGSEMPDGAIRLRANTPTPYEDGRLVASNLWDDAIMLEFQGNGSVETVDLSVGEQAPLGEHTFELIEVWEDPGADEAEDGALESYAVVLPVE